MVWNLDVCCSKDHRPSHNIFFKVQTQSSNKKNLPHSKEPKNKNLKLILPRHNIVKLAKKKEQEEKILKV